MELLRLLILGVLLAQLLHTLDKEIELLDEHFQDLHILVIDWFV